MKSEDINDHSSKIKNKNVITYSLLILIIIGLAGYILYEKKLIFNSSTNENNYSSSTAPKDDTSKSNETTEIAIDSTSVTQSLASYNKLILTDSNLYQSNTYNNANITNHDLVATTISLVEKKYTKSACEEEEPTPVSLDYLNSLINNYLLNTSITLANIKTLSTEINADEVRYLIDDNALVITDNQVKIITSCGKEFDASDYTNKKLLKAEENNDYVYIYQKLAFAKYNFDESSGPGDELKVDYYKDFQKNNKIESGLTTSEEIDSNGNSLANSTPDWDLYNTYKYTFKKQNNNYYFVTLELV